MPFCLNEVLVKKLGYALPKPMTILATELRSTALKNSQFTWIFVGNRSLAYKIWALDCKDILRDRNCFMWIPRWLYNKVLMYFDGGGKASLYCILRDRWKNLKTARSLKPPWKRLGSALALYTSSYDRKCKSALVSKRSAGPSLVRGPIRRNRSNRFKTGPVCERTSSTMMQVKSKNRNRVADDTQDHSLQAPTCHH